MSTCRYCKADIAWVQEFGKWRPVDAGGGVHRCPVLVERAEAARAQAADRRRKEFLRLMAQERETASPGVGAVLREGRALERALRERLEREP